MNTMAGEYLSMKDSLTHHAALMEKVQDENLKLKSLIEESFQDKKNRDSQLDEIGREVKQIIFSPTITKQSY
jgi:hypothetical protein